MGALRRQSKDLLQLVGDRRGSAVVEFGLLAPVLCLLAAGAIDASRLVIRSMQVRAAAQAGADAALRAASWDPAKVSLAVTSTANAGITAAPTPAIATLCVTGKILAPPTGALCADQGTPGRFASISAAGSFATVFPWPGLDIPNTLSARATVRLP